MTRHVWCCSCSNCKLKSQTILPSRRLFFLFHAVSILAVASSHRQPKPPLSTSSRWIVDRVGERVKLSCVTWAGHLEAGIPEGLSKNTAQGIAELITSNGFNCVRLTSSTSLWADDAYGALTVAQSFNILNIQSSGVGLAAWNPAYYLLSLREVHHRVVDVLTSHGLMVILENHVSRPQWCCSDTDGNGFWGDEFFDVGSWLRGLTGKARSFVTNPLVVAIGLRNELRGPRENNMDWKVLMAQAAEAVHDVNPNVLLIAGGLSSGTDLSFLRNQTLDSTRFMNKMVYAFHWYEWSHLEGGSGFRNESDQSVCSRVQSNVHGKNGFLVERGVPLLLSEFGMNLNSPDYAENRFLECVIDYLEKVDLDWAFWALQGSYYLRNDEQDADEAFGLLGNEWQTFRNPNVVARLQYTIQNSTQGMCA